MRFTALLIVLLITSVSFTYSQDYKYNPFPDSNSIWSERYLHPWNSGKPPVFYIHAIFNEDTIINSIKYQKLFVLYDTIIVKENAEYLGAIREDSVKRIYYRGENQFFGIDSTRLNENCEMLIYDFSVGVGDTLRNLMFALSYEYLVVSRIDTILFMDHKRRVISFERFQELKWIDGIGSTRGLLFLSGDYPNNGLRNDLLCFRQNNSTIYLNPLFNTCLVSTSSVNEKSKVNSVRVHPNPVKNVSSLSLSKSYDRLEIFNSMGSKLISENVSNIERYEINVMHFKSGVYIYRLLSHNGSFTIGRFIINRQ